MKDLENMGIGEIKVTYVNLEGSGKGMEIEFSKNILSKIKVPLIFEGGIGNLRHLSKCQKQFEFNRLRSNDHFSDYNIVKIKQYLKNLNYNVRI